MFAYVTSAFLVAVMLQPTDYVRDKYRLRTDREVAAWGVTDSLLVVVRGSSQVTVHNLADGTEVAAFMVPGFHYPETPIVVAPSRKPVLVRVAPAIGGDSSQLFFLDVRTGRKLGPVDVPHCCSFNPIGVERDGSAICGETIYPNARIFVIDMTTRQVAAAVDNPDMQTIGVTAAPGNNAFVDFDRTSAVCRDRQGHVLWTARSSPSSPSSMLEPLQCHGVAPAVLLALESDMNGQSMQVVALSYGDGRRLWTKRVKEITELVAVSPDGTTQAFFEDRALALTRLPEDRRMALEWNGGCPEGQFTPDGSRLVVIPRLRVVERDEQQHEDNFGRQSGQCAVFECSSGRSVATFAVDATSTRPAPKP
jgi:hypothetical protein